MRSRVSPPRRPELPAQERFEPTPAHCCRRRRAACAVRPSSRWPSPPGRRLSRPPTTPTIRRKPCCCASCAARGRTASAACPRGPEMGALCVRLLRVPRAEIDAFARAKGLVWREDSSNRSHAYARNRLRSRWVPGLREDFNPALLRAIVDLAEAQRTDAEWIQWAVERELGARVRATTGGLRLARSGWSELHDALARRLVARLLTNCGTGRDVRRVHLMRMLHFLRGGPHGDADRAPGWTCSALRARGLLARASRGAREPRVLGYVSCAEIRLQDPSVRCVEL